MLSGNASDWGQIVVVKRLFVKGALWVLRSGAHWRDPSQRGKSKRLRKRFSRRAKASVREHLFEALIGDLKDEHLMLDAALVRAHQQPATGKGEAEPGFRVFPRQIDHKG
ncbi:transposase [Methylocapsa aurea]|uniref:transposase n=1 Tax=Methylocapsa aurea TaxID=663610 RepID=UPI00138E472E|nr:transposase [Methylocapsa aurea]